MPLYATNGKLFQQTVNIKSYSFSLTTYKFFCRADYDVAGKYRSSHRKCSVRKSVLRNFAKFTGKHLCQGLFFNKVAGDPAKRRDKEPLSQ